MDAQEAVRIAEAEIKGIQYPTKPQKPAKANGESNKDFGARLDTYEWDLATFRKALSDNRAAEAKVYERLRDNLFDAFDLKNNPKRNALWRRAWEDGHSGGAYEIADVFENLVELIA